MDTTVMEEKKFNPRLTKSKAEFVEIMNNLNLPYPKQIGNLFLKKTLFKVYLIIIIFKIQIKRFRLIKCAACTTCLPNLKRNSSRRFKSSCSLIPTKYISLVLLKILLWGFTKFIYFLGLINHRMH